MLLLTSIQADRNLDFFLGHLSNNFGEGGEVWEENRHHNVGAGRKSSWRRTTSLRRWRVLPIQQSSYGPLAIDRADVTSVDVTAAQRGL